MTIQELLIIEQLELKLKDLTYIDVGVFKRYGFRIHDNEVIVIYPNGSIGHRSKLGYDIINVDKAKILIRFYKKWKMLF